MADRREETTSDTTTLTLAFAAAARRLGAVLREMGLVAPAFRSPPRTSDDRTVRHYDGGSVVSVRLRDRAVEDWQRDMVDGVLAANDQPLDHPQRWRLEEAARG